MLTLNEDSLVEINSGKLYGKPGLSYTNISNQLYLYETEVSTYGCILSLYEFMPFLYKCNNLIYQCMELVKCQIEMWNRSRNMYVRIDHVFNECITNETKVHVYIMWIHLFLYRSKVSLLLLYHFHNIWNQRSLHRTLSSTCKFKLAIYETNTLFHQSQITMYLSICIFICIWVA